MPRGRRTQYVRDANGRFSSTPGGGASSLGAARKANSPGARRKTATKPRVTVGTLAARSSLRQSRAKLATSSTPQQRAAVTRGNKKLTQVRQESKRKAPAMSGVLRGSIAQRLKKYPAKTSAASPKTKPVTAKISTKKGAPTAEQLKAQAMVTRKARAQKIKETVNRKGVVKGENFNDGRDVSTMSMAEMRKAVRQKFRSIGVNTKKEFRFMTQRDTPKTRSDWEQLYRETIAVPMSERNRKARPGIINGIDIQKNFRPWAVFGLNPKTATNADIQAAFRRVAKQVHPDMGGRAKDLERIKKMRDSILAMREVTQKPASRKSKGKSKSASAPASPPPRGPLLLPPARTPDRPKRRGKTKSTAN